MSPSCCEGSGAKRRDPRRASGLWGEEEIGVTVGVYFRMLTLEPAGGELYNSRICREFDRTPAIKYKFTNFSGDP